MAIKKPSPAPKGGGGKKKRQKGDTQGPDPRGHRVLVIRNGKKVWLWSGEL